MPPQIPKFSLRQCTKCGAQLGSDMFLQTKSPFYPDGFVPWCYDCLEKMIELNEYNWETIDRLCQFIDIPFIPIEYEKLHAINGSRAFRIYAAMFSRKEYERLGWGEYHKRFIELRDAQQIEAELPELREEKVKKLQARWGANYDYEALVYLENLYQGLCTTQNVSSALQIDQALKVCKLSYEIDERIRNGENFDKILTSYDKIVKAADFTPKSTKITGDFDSVGELIHWLEKRGWKPKYFDKVTRDIVDETMQNIQTWNQRLYTEESGIGDEITRRIEALKNAKALEEGSSFYTEELASNEVLDDYSNEGFNKLFKEDENFNEEVE